MSENSTGPSDLAALITRRASIQTYYTIALLADRKLKSDAFRAYAYFRWLDDELDDRMKDRSERIALVKRQRQLLACTYGGKVATSLAPEERLLPVLLRAETRPDSGLRAYVHHMMSVMDFDVRRRGCLVSEGELSGYTRHLAIAVTEAMHHFIGHGQAAPVSKSRYLAASAAHITHMLRDTLEDTGLGYFNIPAEFLKLHRISPEDVDSDPYRLWVGSRVALAREYLRAGKVYLASVGSLRCRIAARFYMARFERVLDVIEQDGFSLRPGYTGREILATGWSV